MKSCCLKEAKTSIRPRPSSVLFSLLIAAAAAINVLPSRAAAKGDLLLIDHDGMQGEIDRTGKMVIEPQCDMRAQPFRDGIARVYTDRDAKTNDDHGYINRTGKFIWPFPPAVRKQPGAQAK